MADNKLEQMLEKLVNNDRAGADELFHEFVIEKSRGIYEKMLETDLEDLDEVKDEEVDESSDDEETNEASDEEVDESSDDEETNEATDEEVDESDEDLDETTDEEVDENFGEFTPEADPMGGDAGDAMMKDIEADGEEGEDGDMDGDEEEIEDRVVDLEDALDDLKMEFEKMMSGEKDGEEGDEDAADMPDMDPEGDEDKDEAFDVGSELSVEDEAPAFEGTKTAGEQMREYVEKVTPKMGDTGTDGTKSPVAGKNDMGGSTANIAKGGTGSEKGSAMSAKEDNMGNVNVPGGKASKSMSANAKGHGAEKKGAGETGTNSKSTIGS
jgi:hypothetical protein